MEREWHSSGNHQDLVRLLIAKLRAGVLDPARLNIAAGLLHPAAQKALDLPVTTRPEGYLRLAPDGGLAARDIPQCLENMWDHDSDREGGRYFSPGMTWQIDVRLEALKIMAQVIQQVHEFVLRRSRMMYGVGPDAGQFTKDRITALQDRIERAIVKTQQSRHVDDWRDMIIEARELIDDLHGALIQVNRAPYDANDANVELREKLLNPVFDWAFGNDVPESGGARRNPDKSLREIEREYGLSGDRKDWLRLQVARMRAGQPYERTFVERTDNREDTYGVSHGEKWLETFFNNGWRIETWWDANYFDTGISVIGWTTIVYDASGDQVGAAVHCGSDDDCAENCHNYRVMDIVSGYIEGGGDEAYPLEDAAPVLLAAAPNVGQRYRRNTDRDLRDLERQATTDSTARRALTKAQERAGIPTTYSICSDCDNYVTEKYLCSTFVGEQCNNYVCVDCARNVTVYDESGWPRSVFCTEHRIMCEACDVLLGGIIQPGLYDGVGRSGIYRCGSCKDAYCGNCRPLQQCGVCDDYICEMCEFYTCESFEHEGEYYPRCGVNLCESCNQVHDCTN
jgi:hypothetical protein